MKRVYVVKFTSAADGSKLSMEFHSRKLAVVYLNRVILDWGYHNAKLVVYRKFDANGR